MTDNLDDLRKQINILDKKIINLLAKRFTVVKKIGEYKKKHNLPSLDEKRWKQVMESSIDAAKSLTLPESFIKKLFTLIHQYSLKLQKNQ